MNEDFWPDLGEEEYEENRAQDILSSQARALEKKTNGMVKATFSKVSYRQNLNGMQSALSTFANILQTTNLSKTENVENEIMQKEDINYLYAKRAYKFEIYNEEYRFRIFTLNYSSEFPIYMTIDEGIRDELNLEQSEIIKSNAELERILIKVFSSEKTKNVLRKMTQASKRKIEEKIKEYLRSNANCSLTDIAEGAGITKISAKNRLDEMEKNGEIGKDKQNGICNWKIIENM